MDSTTVTFQPSAILGEPFIWTAALSKSWIVQEKTALLPHAKTMSKSATPKASDRNRHFFTSMQWKAAVIS